MTEPNALAVQTPQAIQPMQPMQMIQVAFQKALESGGPEALAVADRILEQMAKQRDYEDRTAFNAALQRIQDKIKPIAKDSENKATHSRYASAYAVDKSIDALMKDERLVLSFEPRPSSKPDMVLIVGVLSLGAYSKEYPLEVPADGKGPNGAGVMSRIHAVGSAITYSKRYIKNMIFNLHYKERDDDGNAAAGNMPSLDERAHVAHIDNIRNAGSKAELQRLYLAALKDAELIGDAGSIQAFIRAKDERLRVL